MAETPSTSAARRLWEVDHPYYCNDSNYYARGDQQPMATYGSWAEFAVEQGDDDMDLNLVFRWDWKPKQYLDDDSPEGVAAYHGSFDDNYRGYTLWLFFMGQRKGLYRWAEVDVCRADEPAIREWLTTRWEHLRTLWEPLS